MIITLYLIVFNSVSGNNQIGFHLPVDNLKTGKVINTFPATYGRVGNIFFTRGRVVSKRGQVG